VPGNHGTTAYHGGRDDLAGQGQVGMGNKGRCGQAQRYHQQVKSAGDQFGHNHAACQQPPDGGFLHSNLR